ncbi:MAG: 4'-phosphopantetheinyl transferase superfamily protein [Desulfamplus sp.]|nr:4'-phosphopantetheinyl transferase superfamily protein [Desulfamplus sp.]
MTLNITAEQYTTNILKQLQLSQELGITINYMEIPFFIKRVIREKTEQHLSDFTTKRNSTFDFDDFKVKFLCQHEIDCVNRYKSMKKQIEWISGRFVVKNMVKQLIAPNIELSDLQILYKEEGSPFLDKFPSVNISITHSGDYVAAALCSTGKKIGIDIEKRDYTPAKSSESDSSNPFSNSFMKIAFTQREIDSIALKYRKDAEEGEEVMRRWTIKEAFLKYIGRGFNEKLKAVEVLDDKILYNGQEVNNIEISSFNIDSNYLLSLIYG